MLSQSPLPKKQPPFWYCFITDYFCPFCKFPQSIQFNRAIEYYALVCGFYPSSCSCARRSKSHTAWLLYHSGVTHTHTQLFLRPWPFRYCRVTHTPCEGHLQNGGQGQSLGLFPDFPESEMEPPGASDSDSISALCAQISSLFASAGDPVSGPQSTGSQSTRLKWLSTRKAGRLPSASPIVHEGEMRPSPRSDLGQWNQAGMR